MFAGLTLTLRPYVKCISVRYETFETFSGVTIFDVFKHSYSANWVCGPVIFVTAPWADSS
jgi:hypothetical protein